MRYCKMLMLFAAWIGLRNKSGHAIIQYLKTYFSSCRANETCCINPEKIAGMNVLNFFIIKIIYTQI